MYKDSADPENTFESSDNAEVRKHLSEVVRTTHGHGPCDSCGERTGYSFTGRLKRKRPIILCPDCKSSLVAEVQAS